MPGHFIYFGPMVPGRTQPYAGPFTTVQRWPETRRQRSDGSVEVGPWLLTLTWEVPAAAGRLTCVGAEVSWDTSEAAQDVGALLLRTLPVGELIANHRGFIFQEIARSVVNKADTAQWETETFGRPIITDEERATMPWDADPALAQALAAAVIPEAQRAGRKPEDLAAQLQARLSSRRRGRRPGHGPEFWTQLAAIYTAAWKRGENPTRAVAEARALGGPRSRTAAAHLVSRARKQGYLGPTEQGRAGGITPAGTHPPTIKEAQA
jgi:hypothetical protein